VFRQDLHKTVCAALANRPIAALFSFFEITCVMFVKITLFPVDRPARGIDTSNYIYENIW